MCIRDRSWVIGLLSRGAVLAIVAAVLAVLALGWLILFVDTLRLAQLRLVQPATRRAAVALTAVGMLLTSGTLVVASRNVSAARDVLNSVFGGSPAAEASAGRYNILLLGGDSGADRYSTRPDSITVVSVDADTGKPVMLSLIHIWLDDEALADPQRPTALLGADHLLVELLARAQADVVHRGTGGDGLGEVGHPHRGDARDV